MKSQVLIQLIARVLNIISNLTVGILIINYLGPEKQGQLAFAINLVGVLGFLVYLGLGPYLSKRLSLNCKLQSLNWLFSIAIILRMFGFIALLTLVSLGYIYLGKLEQLYIPGIILLSHFFIAINVYKDLYEGIGKVGDYAKINILVVIVTSVCKVVVIYWSLELWVVSFIYVIEQALNYSLSKYYFSTKNLNIKIQKNISFKRLALLLKRVMPLCLSSIVISFFTQMDILAIGFFMDDKSVGIYSAATRVTTPFYIFSGILISVYFAKLNSSYHTNKLVFYKLVTNLSNISLLFSLSIVIGFYGLGSYVFEFLFSSEFYSAFDISLILICALPFIYLGPLTGKYLIIKGDFKLELKKTGAAAIFNLIFSLIFIPIYGIKAAAIGTLASYLIANYLFLYLHSEHQVMLKAIHSLRIYKRII